MVGTCKEPTFFIFGRCEPLNATSVRENLSVAFQRVNSLALLVGRSNGPLKPSFFLFTWVHLYKSDSIYIKYVPLFFMACNMDNDARLDALRH